MIPMRARLPALLGTLADLALPRVCGACGLALAAGVRSLCHGCRRAAPGTARPRCPGCALPAGDTPDTPHGQRSLPPVPALCLRCLAGAPPHDATLAWADYAPPLDRLVGALKFRGQWRLGAALGDAMAQAPAVRHSAARFAPSRVTWVPLGAARLRERGYNPSRAIAVAFARGVGWPPPRPLLRRTRDTAAQSATGGADRWANVAGAFTALASLSGESVVLVDDVMTTGATVSAAAESLKRAGAREVIVVVGARAAVAPEHL